MGKFEAAGPPTKERSTQYASDPRPRAARSAGAAPALPGECRLFVRERARRAAHHIDGTQESIRFSLNSLLAHRRNAHGIARRYQHQW